MIWRAYFAFCFPIPVIRATALLHAVCAFGIIFSIIVHITQPYGSRARLAPWCVARATFGWARKHHPRWFEEVVRKTRD